MDEKLEEAATSTERRSQRKRKQKESYSPDRQTNEGERKKTKEQKAQLKTLVNRTYDVLPNGMNKEFEIFQG